MKSNLPQLNISRVTGRSGLTALTWPHKKGTKIGVFIRYASVWADGLENEMKELCQWPDVFFRKHHHEHIWKKLKTFTSYALHRNQCPLFIFAVTEWIDEILSSASLRFYETTIACGPVFNVLQNRNESWSPKHELKVMNLLFGGKIFNSKNRGDE